MSASTPLVWPPFATDPAVPAMRWISGLGESQAWTHAQLRTGQRLQLQALARWATAKVPYYRSPRWREPMLAAANAGPEDFDQRWREVPILTKPDIRAQGSRLQAQGLARSEMPLDSMRTSGSTGIPVEVHRNATARSFWQALTLRETYWLGRDLSGCLGVARHLPRERRSEAGEVFADWGRPYTPTHRTGPRAVIHISYPLDVIDRWLEQRRPNVFLTYPSLVAGLLDLRGSRGAPPGLAEVSLISEPVSEELKQRLATQWGVKCSESYSAVDGGYIALQCGSGRLHVQSEAVHVELLRADGTPCSAGETGRVVITPLHYLAMPLLRYAIGDFAVAGSGCPCGREHPVIEQVLGRERNLVRRPDGSSSWPSGLRKIATVAPVEQAQFIQTQLDRIELRVKMTRPLQGSEREDLVGVVRKILHYPFTVDVIEVGQIERGPTGKYEEFVSKLEVPQHTGADA